MLHLSGLQVEITNMLYCLFCLCVFILGILIGVLIVLNYLEKEEEKILSIMEHKMEEQKELMKKITL